MGDTTMFRLAALLVVLSASALSEDLKETQQFDSIYLESDYNKVTNASLECEGVENSVPDCSDCYSCEDSKVAEHENRGRNITKLKLNGLNCENSKTICCISQGLYDFREKPALESTRCGRSNPEGYPRALRPKLRSVLLGEYPWRARIYHFQDPSTPLCAATFINEESRTLITAASCVAGLNPYSLRVLFEEDSNNYDPMNVLKVDVHEFYDKGSNENNIALLSLESVPGWARPACLPIRPALHGTACVAVSSEDYFINQVVPLQVTCNENNQTLHGSLMCAASYKGDYIPQFGGGMFCLDEQSHPEVYRLYGVYLYRTRNGMAAINVNVNHFAGWIANKTHTGTHRNYK